MDGFEDDCFLLGVCLWFKGANCESREGGFFAVGFSIFDTKKVTCLGFCEIWQFELNKKKHSHKKKNCPWKKTLWDRWWSQSFHEKHWKAEKRRKEGWKLELMIIIWCTLQVAYVYPYIWIIIYLMKVNQKKKLCLLRDDFLIRSSQLAALKHI